VKTPPRLIARTLTVTFAMVAVILTVVFVVITLDVRDRVRAAESDKLRVSENVFSALETKRQQDQVAAMATLAENPTLKAALDTYFTERRFSGSSDEQLRATVMGETAKLAMQTPADVLAVVETDGKIFSSAGPAAARWPIGTKVDIPGGTQPAFQTRSGAPRRCVPRHRGTADVRRSSNRRARGGHQPRRKLRAGALEPVRGRCCDHCERLGRCANGPGRSRTRSRTVARQRRYGEAQQRGVCDPADAPFRAGAHLHADIG
jgi:hypothetical protein